MKINLTEKEIRKIARKVILRNELITEASVSKEENDPSKEVEEEEKKEKTEYEDIVKIGSTDNLAVNAAGTSDRLQDVASIPLQAAGAAGVTLGALTLFNMGAAGLGAAGAAVTSGAGVTAAAGAGLGAAILGTGASAVAAAETLGAVALGVASGPIGWGALAVAGGAGLYYMFAPETTGTNALKEALDTTLYFRVSAGFTKIYDQLRNSDDPGVRAMADKMNPKVCLDVPSSNEATKIADKIYNATQGGMLGLGIGTDEEAVESALRECKSFLGVSRVSFKHAKMKEGIIDDGNLLKVLTGEFDNSDMERYVNSVIDELPYIIVNGKEYSKEEFQQWLVESKELTDKMLSNLKDVAEEEGEEESTANTEALKVPYIKQIQRLINEYCSKKGIEYTPLKQDGAWGPKTTALWKDIYLPHVFANHPIFSTLGLKIGNSKWEGISAQLSGKYPGYTSGEKGCARFCIDSLYGNTLKGEETDKDDSAISYYIGKSTSRKGSKTKEPDVKGEKEKAEKIEKVPEREFVPSDGRLTYKNIKIDVDVVGNRGIKKLSQLPGAPLDADEELKYDFLTNFGARRLDVPDPGQTYQIHIHTKKDGKISIKHKSTKMFKTAGIRTFAMPFHRFFKGINMSDADIKRLKIEKDSPIIIKVIMPPGLYNPAVER